MTVIRNRMKGRDQHMSNQPTDAPATVHVVYQGAYEGRIVVCAAPTRSDAERIAERLGGADGDAYAAEIPVHSWDVRIVHVLQLRCDVHESGTREIRRWVESTTPEHTKKRDDVPCRWVWRKRNRFRNHPPFWNVEAWGTDHDLVQRVFDGLRDKLASDPEYRDRDEMSGEGPL